jgi:hypothetical protein
VSVKPGAALLVVVGKDERNCFTAPALAEETVRVTVCGRAPNCHRSYAKLLVERFCCAGCLRHLPAPHPKYRTIKNQGNYHGGEPEPASHADTQQCSSQLPSLPPVRPFRHCEEPNGETGAQVTGIEGSRCTSTPLVEGAPLTFAELTTRTAAPTVSPRCRNRTYREARQSPEA